MRAVCVVAARPNFMKMKPVLDALEGCGIETVLVHTGQHYDPDMSEVFFDELGMRAPDHHLEIAPGGTHGQQTARVIEGFDPLAKRLEPDVVVVVGDVNSTLACALVAAKHGHQVAHVEAGLRSRDWSMPEEINRVVVDRVSDYLFAPSGDAAFNLRQEGYREDQIFVVGNVMIDTLLANLERALARPTLKVLGVEALRYGLVTLHRPSNVDDPATFSRLLGALGEVADQCPLIFPVHPRTRTMVENSRLPAGITVVPPVGYLDMIALEATARLVLTDSGGVQEETTVLGVPCITLRESTERPITVSEGTNQIAGTDPSRILAAAGKALAGGVPARRPALWDGRAGTRIAEVFVRNSGVTRRRPTEREPNPALGGEGRLSPDAPGIMMNALADRSRA